MTSISSLNTLSAKTGIGGLMSGMDIDELVVNLTARSREKIHKQQQSIQNLQWKQSAYRTVTEALTEFHSSYLDLLSTTNFRSSSFFNTIKATSSSSSVVSAVSTSAARSGTITIEYIEQLAEKQKINGSEAISKNLEGTISSNGTLSADDIVSLLSSIQGKSISLVLDGRLKTVTFDNSFIQAASSDLSEAGLKNAFQSAVDKAFGVMNNDDRIINVNIENGQLSINADTSVISVRAVGGDTATLDMLGLSDGKSNRISLYSKLDQASLSKDLSSDVDIYKFTINSVDFEFNKDVTLADIIREVEASSAGVSFQYSSLSDSFILTAKETGAGDNIRIQETQGNLMTALGLTDAGGANIEYGKNAILSVNGREIVRSSNDILIDGVNIELHQKTGKEDPPLIITLNEDASSLLDPIKNFVEDYNALLDLINGLTSEKPNPKYQPLSEEQKSEMTDKQIEQWEEKAKAGILRNDPVLRGLLSELRGAMLGSISKGSINLFDLGISTGSYQDYGKLKINDEAKLIETLKTRGPEVMELFTGKERGLANRMYETIQGAIKNTGGKNHRGSLIELAGIEASTSDFENSISERINRANKRIAELQMRLTSEESQLWRKFTAMETALQRLDIQSGMLMQFMDNR